MAAADDSGSRPVCAEDGTPLEYASSCYLPTSWVPCPLVAKTEYSKDASVYEFGLPEGQSLDLPVCSCILVRPPDGEGARPYTPISSGKETGRFRLLIKRYPDGKVSSYIASLAVGEKAFFKHIPKNVKEQHPFRRKKISMLCGGTGITPIYQALQRIAETPEHPYECVVLFGNRTPADILMKKELDDLVERTSGRVKVVYVVGSGGKTDPIPGWSGEVGWVDEEKVKKYCHPPSDDTMVMVCGLPALYKSMCGPREDPEVAEGTALHKLGYTKEMVVKF
eukprot:TRINITY_DN4165_c0_g3_i3.p1 TRINITY_DN4165_c0_g3~~TRINITY_DN4165_c0_g3_i3.p1  ORF type:complete len:280 (+),score=91.18 TRINITY_DN4165_c0_g3_i3:228-1067(+)